MKVQALVFVLAACPGATVDLGPSPIGKKAACPARGRAPVENCARHVEHACIAPVPRAVVPLSTVEPGLVVHWPMCEGCIAVTLDPALHDRANDLQQALDLWACGAAGALCFDGPTETTNRGGLHVTIATVDASIANLVEVTTNRATGRIAAATIALADDVTPRALGSAVGAALGLQLVATGDSLMNPTLAGGGLQLSDPDLGTIRALYGEQPYCE